MSSCMSQYVNLQQFASVEEMNQFIKKVKKQFASELNKTARAVLDYLARHSCKVKGVSLLKVKTIAKGLGKGERTIRSITALLSKLGVVDKISQTRKITGGDGANVYVIKSDCLADCRGEIAERGPSETPTISKQKATLSDKEALGFKAALKSFKKVEKGDSEKSPVDKLDSLLYPDIPQLIKVSLGRLKNNRFANSLWKKVIQAYSCSSLRRLFPTRKLQEICSVDEDFSSQLYKKIHNALHAYQAGDITSTIEGYLYTVVSNFFEDERLAYEKIYVPHYESDIPFYDWLNG